VLSSKYLTNWSFRLLSGNIAEKASETAAPPHSKPRRFLMTKSAKASARLGSLEAATCLTFNGKIAIITGSSKGIGKAIALSLAQTASILLTARSSMAMALDQDYITFARAKSFFGSGCVAHVSMADPVCGRLSALAAQAGRACGTAIVEGGTYLCMEGPQFSTRAESELYRTWGCDVIGMTAMPEAKLAREAELPYAAIAMVTDYDCWHDDHDAVDVAAVIEVLKGNAEQAGALIKALAQNLGQTPRTPSPQGIETCLDRALITAVEARDPALCAKLDAVAGRVLKG